MRLALCLLFLLITLAGCDSLTITPAEAEAVSAREAISIITRGSEGATRSMPLCVRGGDGHFQKVSVPRSEVAAYIERGAELPEGDRLDRFCQSRAPRASCPCFTPSDLAVSYGQSEVLPYLFFDTFNWYGQDNRRTEVRWFVDVDGMAREGAASVYITPGLHDNLVPICHLQSIQEDPLSGEAEYVYVTKEPSIAQAEACRQVLYAFAGDLECQGPACGMAYSRAQLDPDYTHYQQQRQVESENRIFQRTIARARELVRQRG
jgi:hypothetical protein